MLRTVYDNLLAADVGNQKGGRELSLLFRTKRRHVERGVTMIDTVQGRAIRLGNNTSIASILVAINILL